MENKIIVYEPDNSIKHGYIYLLKHILIEVMQNKWLIYQLFRRDFIVSYKQSLLGYFWIFITPFMSIASFVLLNKAGVFNEGNIKVPYPIYAMVGIFFWNILNVGLIASSNCLINAGSLILKINVSKKSIVISSVLQSLIPCCVHLLILVCLFIYYSFLPDITIILIPLLILPIFFVTLGLGFLVSILNGISRDFGNIVSMGLIFLLFLTPILYEKPKYGIIEKITLLNPIYYLIAIPRDLILFKRYDEIYFFSLVFVLSTMFFLFCIMVFHLTETRITERI